MGFYPPSVGGTVEVAELESLAKGSTIAGDGTGAPVALAIGSNGAVLQAASGTATGLSWNTIVDLVDAVKWTAGTAVVATAYSVQRDADGTNQLHFNVPTGATFEWSVNDVVEMTLSATAVNFQNNSISTTGGGSLTGTWTDLGSVTTVDINGGTIDGATIGGAVAGAGTFTALVATSLDLNGALDLDVAALGATLTNTADAASSQVMILEGDRATMGDNDEAYLTMRLSNDAGAQTEVARLTWVATDVNVATGVDGRIDFAVMTGGALADELQLDGAALSPSTTAGLALGTTTLGFTNLYLSSSAATQINIQVENQGAGNNTAGRPLLIAAGAAGSLTTGAAGGNLFFEGGNARGSGDNNGGNINFTPGTATALGQVGAVNINQPGGTPGTDAIGFTHNGTDAVMINLDTQGDVVFGIGAGNNSFSVSAESVILSNDILIRRDVNAGLTASTTQTQGNGALTAEVNEVATVANVNDTVTLPTAVAGLRIVIINNGANTLRIFPASGDNLGAGVDTATTLAAGSNVIYQSYNDTNWESI